jgi:hypothetical protein
MKLSTRIYHCARCHCQVVICSDCDRGNVYCNTGCAKDARTESLSQANKKYQSSRKGRFSNAARQQRFRLQKKQIVTDQGSASPEADALLPDDTKKQIHVVQKARVSEKMHICCHFCQRECDLYLRLGFIRHRMRVGQLKKTTKGFKIGNKQRQRS